MITPRLLCEILAAMHRTACRRICEFGNQQLYQPWAHRKPLASSYFRNELGAEYVSIDIKGEGGALALDLSNEIADPMLLGKFDVVTNMGTLEHVAGQENGFRNMHNLCRIGGLMVHALPTSPSYAGHGLYTYDMDFVTSLADACKYEIVKCELMRIERIPAHGIHGGVLVVATVRRTHTPFVWKGTG